MGRDATEPMTRAGSTTPRCPFPSKWQKRCGRWLRILPTGLGEAVLPRVFLVCVLLLVLGLVLAVSAVGRTATDPLARDAFVVNRRPSATQVVGMRGEAVQSGSSLALTDTTRVFLPSVFRNLKPPGAILTDRQRFGFVAVSGNWTERFDVDRLQAGWYVDATNPECGVAPAGTERALILPIQTGYSINPAWLGPQVDRHPRTLWLIGNEPDCIHQDNVWPEEYARIYHDLYVYIKHRDPQSRISPGGIVQPSPLRLEWLSRVLRAYRSYYGRDMPVDVWNIHNGILPEQHPGWGADIPPGIDATKGVIRDVQDNDSIEIFQEQIWTFRRWMADNGYSGYPLVVSEYGILMPEMYGFGADRVKRFMSATFDFFQNATDPELGDPGDEYRLVQRWAWFSLDIPPYDPDKNTGFNGNLFDPETRVITEFGLRFSSEAGSHPLLETVDLRAEMARLQPLSSPITPTQTVSRTIVLDVQNAGNRASRLFAVTLTYRGPVSGVMSQVVSNVAPTSSVELSFVLTDLGPGGYEIVVQIDPENRVLESTECNNTIETMMVVPSDIAYLPLVVHGAR